jgi:hypothetical protein
MKGIRKHELALGNTRSPTQHAMTLIGMWRKIQPTTFNINLPIHTSDEHKNPRLRVPHEVAFLSTESYPASQMLHREDRSHAFESTNRKTVEARLIEESEAHVLV